MNRHWLRTIIRMLNAVEEQLGEFAMRQDVVSPIAYNVAKQHVRSAIKELNEHFDNLQVLGK